MSKSIAFSAAALALVVSNASANLVFDLRASAITPALGSLGDASGKNVQITPGATGDITLQLWVQISNAAPGAGNPFGIQTMIGSVVSQTTSPGVTGAIGAAIPAGPFGVGGVAGGATEFSASYGGAADGILDRGSNSTSSVTAYSKFRADTTDVNGTLIGTQFFPTNTNPNGATVRNISSGFELLVGTFTLNIAGFQNGSAFSVNWKLPLVTSPANKGQIASWVDGSVAAGPSAVPKNGNANFAEMSVGSTLSLVTVPEPSAFGMVLLGAMGMVGFRRLGARRF